MRRAWACFLCFWLAGNAWAAEITVSANWSTTVNRDNLIAGAGTHLQNPIESAPAVATLNISNTLGASWSVRVAKNDGSWPANVGIAVKRNSNGSGSGTISSGTAYVAVDSISNAFFSGTGDRSGIEIQLKVDGLSINTPPAPYSLVITYTVQSP